MTNEHMTNERDRETLLDALKTIASCADYTKVHRLVLEQLARVTDALGGSLFAFQSGELVLKHSLDKNRDLPAKIALPLRPKSASAHALQAQEALLVTEIGKEQRSGWSGYNDGSFLVLPLCDVEENILCLVNLHNKRVPPFQPKDLDMARVLLSAAAAMIQGLHERTVLEARQTYFLDLLNHLPTGFLLLDQDGTIVDTNQVFGELVDRSAADCLGTGYAALTHPDDRAGEATFMETLSEQPSGGFQKRFLTARGDAVSTRVFFKRFNRDDTDQILVSVAPD